MDNKNINRPDDSLPYYIRGAFRGFETALSRYLVHYDLPLSHFYVLRLQWHDDGHTQKDISERAFMTESVLSQVIKAMEHNKLLLRKPDPADARKRRVFLTEKGQHLRGKIVKEGISISQSNAPNISPEDIKTTMDVLTKIRNAFNVYNAQYEK